MPTIPVYNQRTTASMAGDGGGPSGGRGLLAVAEAAQSLDDVNVRIQARDNAIEADSKLSELRMRTAERLQEAKANASPDAKDFTPSALKSFDDDVKSVSDGLDPNVAAIIRNKAKDIRESVFLNSIAYEAATRMAFQSGEFSRSTDRLAVAVELNPDDYQSAVTEQAETLEMLRLPPEERAALRERSVAMLTEAAANGLAKEDPATLLAGLQKEKSGDPRIDELSPAARDRVERVATSQVVINQSERIAAAYEAGGPAAGSAALAALGKSGLSPEIQSDIVAQVSQQVGAMRAQKREQFASEFVEVERALGNGSAGATARRTVEKLYNAGAMTVSEYANYQGQIERVSAARQVQQAEAVNITEMLASGLPLDPTDARQVKALGSAFSIASSEHPVGSEGWQSIALSYAAKARILPPQAEAWTRQAMRSPNAELRANAALFYGNLEQTAPEAVSGFDVPTKGYAGLVSSMVNAGADPVLAAKTAHDITYAVTQQVTEQRREAYRDMVKGNLGAMADLIDRDFDTAFTSQPVPTQAIQADFGMQVERYFTATGDIGVARAMAWKDVTRVYGPSRVNGRPMLMMMPPERFGVSPEWVREDIGEWLKANPQADGTSAEDVFLIPDAVTQRNAFSLYDGKPVRPSYKVTGKSGEVLVGADGQAVRYTIPTTDEAMSRYEADKAKKSADLVDSARMKRRVEQNILLEQDRKRSPLDF